MRSVADLTHCSVPAIAMLRLSSELWQTYFSSSRSFSTSKVSSQPTSTSTLTPPSSSKSDCDAADSVKAPCSGLKVNMAAAWSLCCQSLPQPRWHGLSSPDYYVLLFFFFFEIMRRGGFTLTMVITPCKARQQLDRKQGAPGVKREKKTLRICTERAQLNQSPRKRWETPVCQWAKQVLYVYRRCSIPKNLAFIVVSVDNGARDGSAKPKFLRNNSFGLLSVRSSVLSILRGS